MRLTSLGITTVMLLCLWPFTLCALSHLLKTVEFGLLGDGLHQKYDVLSDYERYMNALKLCFCSC